MIDISVCILCGGKGTRLGELTANTPKSLVLVCNRPFLVWQLEILAKQRVTRVLLCVGHFGEQIQRFILRGARTDMKIECIYDGPAPLGQIGAIRNAASWANYLGAEFLILYGDSFLDVDYAPIVATGRRLKRPVQATFGGMDYGITYMTTEGLAGLPPEATMSNLAAIGAAEGYPMPSRWYQIGDLEGLADVELLLRARTGVSSNS